MHKGKGMKFVGDSRMPWKEHQKYQRLFRVSW